jgi:two-component system KDP operon response regulator KdpE
MASILVVDDEPQIRRFLGISLGANGYRVVEAETAIAGIELARTSEVDLVILDLGLPDLDGQEAIGAIREFSTVPIIVLSARSGEHDKVEALDRGANDYVVKPFGIGELMARVRAALRLGKDEEGEVMQIGALEFDFARRVILKKGREVHLSKREYDLLHFLASHADHVLTHKRILAALWGPAHAEDVYVLRVYVNQLRQKLEADPSSPKLIVTEPGVGYRLRLDSATASRGARPA